MVHYIQPFSFFQVFHIAAAIFEQLLFCCIGNLFKSLFICFRLLPSSLGLIFTFHLTSHLPSVLLTTTSFGCFLLFLPCFSCGHLAFIPSGSTLLLVLSSLIRFKISALNLDSISYYFNGSLFHIIFGFSVAIVQT